jgi:transcription factor CON7
MQKQNTFSETQTNITDQASTAQYTPQSEVRSATGLSNSNTPQSDYSLNPTSARSTGYSAEYLTRHPQYQHASQHQGAIGSMAQATSPSMSLQDGGTPHDRRSGSRMKSDSDVPIDPSIAQQTSPAYPPPYSPYNAQGPHEMPHYPNQPPPGMYRPNPPDWPPQYGHSHGMPGQYSGPGPNVSSASPATAGSRSGQVRSLFSLSLSLSLFGFSRLVWDELFSSAPFLS